MKVIFLDIDGVLNDDNTYKTERTPDGFCGIDDSKLLLLKEIIDKTEAKIVLDSSWKSFWKDDTNLDNKYLCDKFANFNIEIIDRTYDDWFDRGKGILNYLNKNKDVNAFVLIDDEIFEDFEKLGFLKYLIKTDSSYGITQKDVQKAIKLLNKK